MRGPCQPFLPETPENKETCDYNCVVAGGQKWVHCLDAGLRLGLITHVISSQGDSVLRCVCEPGPSPLERERA